MRRPLSGEGLMSTGFGDLKIFSGSSHPSLTKEIAEFLGIPVGQARLRRFPGQRGLLPDRREHSRRRRLHRPADLQSGGPAPDGAAGDDRRVPPLVGGADHGGDPVLRLRAAGSQGQAARADFGEAGGEPAQRGGHESGADDGSAQGADPGVLRHPGGPSVRGAGDHRVPGAAGQPEPDDRVAGRRRRRTRAGLREAARRRTGGRRQAARRRTARPK